MNTVSELISPFLDKFPDSKIGELIDFIQFLKTRYDSDRQEDDEVSPEMEKELLEISAETKRELAEGAIKPQTVEEHLKWFRTL